MEQIERKRREEEERHIREEEERPRREEEEKTMREEDRERHSSSFLKSLLELEQLLERWTARVHNETESNGGPLDFNLLASETNAAESEAYTQLLLQSEAIKEAAKAQDDLTKAIPTMLDNRIGQQKIEEEMERRRKIEQQRQEREEREEREEIERKEKEYKIREERKKRKREEQERLRVEEEERKRREEEERRRRAEEERLRREEEERRIREEQERVRKLEEERLRREEEERRRKEEEERLKRAEERRLRREAKEKRRREREEAERIEREAEEKRKRELEEERRRREEERSWRPLVLPVKDSELHSNHGCAIRAPTGACLRDEFRCTTVPDLIKLDSFASSEEVVGNAIRLELGTTARGRRVEWFVALPHCAQRVPGRETVLYAYKNDSWEELPSDEIQLDSLPSEHHWVETRISDPSVTLVPVNRWKINRFSLTRQGVELVSQIDNRIRLSIPPDSYIPRAAILEQQFEARPIDASAIDDLRNSHSSEFSEVIATSALVKHTTSASKPVPMSMMYTLHLPRNGRRNSTIVNGQRSVPQSIGEKMHSGVATRGVTIIANIDTHDIGARWTALEKIVGEEAAARDKLIIRLSSLSNRKLLALRVTNDFNDENLDPVCRKIEMAMETHVVCLIVGQSADSRQALVAVPSMKVVQNMLGILNAKDFRHITSPTPANGDAAAFELSLLRVKERQMLQINLTGNISSKEGANFTVMIHSRLNSYRLLTLIPKDPYMQASQTRYIGFVQAFSEFQPMRLAKVQLQLTKLDADKGPVTAWKSPFDYKPRDAVTVEYLESLAVLVADNWPILADRLGLPKERCSAIKSSGHDPSEQALNMLIDWLKGTPYAMSKSPVLAKALRSSGYHQLGNELQKRENRLQANQEIESDIDKNATYY